MSFLFACLILSLPVTLPFALCAQSPDKNVHDAFMISRMAEKYHIQPRPLNHEMSAAIYSRILEVLDDHRIFFTEGDIRQLSVYRFTLDDEIRGQKSGFLQLLTGIYKQRLAQVDTMIDHITAKPFDFYKRERLTVPEDTSYPADPAAMHTKIYKLMKWSLLRNIADYLTFRETSPGAKIPDSVEFHLRKKAGVSIRRSIKRVLQSPMGIENTIGIIYCQVLANCYDPHTDYFPPEEKTAFEALLGNKPLSYGLSLKEDDDGDPRIGRLEPGGPAFQSGGLNEGDKILSVSWDDKAPIDVANADLREMNGILATEGGSKLTLVVRKADGTVRPVSLYKARLASSDEEDKVKGFILKGSRVVGYIALPAFYKDWENGNGINGCANDVAKEIIKLKKENIEGLILDLRYNGGGSMEEAVELSGIFIDAGPVAQVKSRNTGGGSAEGQSSGNEARVITLKDVNRGTIYDGPLLLLVNGSSASASEMVAGTLQDYHRALIAGSPTYGKATAQIVLPMDTTIDLDNYKGQGEASSYLKVTISRLYRVNGTTAQMTGVQPDVLLPEPLQAFAQREADEKFALPPSIIEANKYYRPLPPLPVAAVQAAADKALAADSFFRKVLHPVSGAGKAAPADVDLYLDDHARESKKDVPDKNESRPGDIVRGNIREGGNTIFVVMNHAYEMQRLKADHELQEVNEERKTNLLYDPYVKVAYQLVAAMIK
jgi:carboxyl-terminal processing protease